ncbi:hypothetical protein WKI65_23835 [Streptomyces sp. MS1.AVA.3]|uniref:hypothetical protein n=1 Tax=Streptomyces decoyicus TaxID=249567 RepID=UPI0030BCB495
MAPDNSVPEHGRPGRVARGIARLLAAAGLAVDAYLHARLAGRYDEVTATIGQGMLSASTPHWPRSPPCSC